MNYKSNLFRPNFLLLHYGSDIRNACHEITGIKNSKEVSSKEHFIVTSYKKFNYIDVIIYFRASERGLEVPRGARTRSTEYAQDSVFCEQV